MKNEVRVRFAPSPTGFLHIGGARTALFNWLYAKNRGGKFILRIEDTDRERSTMESEDVILRAMKWLGLEWDEGPETGGDYGPYRQSDRLDIYRKYSHKLLNEKKAFKCYCTPEELEAHREEALKNEKLPVYSGRCRNLDARQIEEFEREGRKPSIRFEVPQGIEITVNDYCKGEVKFNSDLIGDFVIEKSDGFPSYNFAVVVDDMLMKITDVIRGDDHLTNTPKQILLYKALGFEVPEFAHIPMILGPDGSRLSKRHGATSVEEYQKQGYVKEALVNFLALLGWNPKNDEEIMTVENIIQKFKLEDVIKSPAVFNTEKLKWMNSQYIKNMELEKLAEISENFVDKSIFDISDKTWFAKILKTAREPISLLTEINSQLVYYFDSTLDKTVNDSIVEIYKVPTAFSVLDNFIQKIENADNDKFDFEGLKPLLKDTQKECNVKGKELFMPLRVALTYKTEGPGVYEMLLALGKEKSLKRMKEFKEKVKNHE
ncbi:MAG: glutamate--tRNA ligase [Candidatus Muiribacteriota bacterium]|jgi:nondiscriminating glutamyl-tRNA synthetase